jgi:hypothetical protein
MSTNMGQTNRESMLKHRLLSPLPRFSNLNWDVGKEFAFLVDFQVFLLLLFQEHTFTTTGLNNTTNMLLVVLNVMQLNPRI